jgi:sulfoxide reductase heme-binding subunit YedZ
MNDQLLWYTTRGAGAVSLLLLSGVVVLGVLGVRRFEATGWPRFLTTALHNNVALIAVVFVAIHVITAIVDPFTNLGIRAALVPFGSYYRTFWLGLGVISMYVSAAIVITSLIRAHIGHSVWRFIHWGAYGCWVLALVHTVGTGTDATSVWMLAIDAVCVAAVMLAAGARLLLPSPDPLAADRARFRERVSREVDR